MNVNQKINKKYFSHMEVFVLLLLSKYSLFFKQDVQLTEILLFLSKVSLPEPLKMHF
jgi:hypothetical protein